MVRNKGHVSDDNTPNSPRESSYRGRGRGRGRVRGRYSKSFGRNNFNTYDPHRSKQSDDSNRSFIAEDSNQTLDYEDSIGGGLADRMTMDDLYDDRSVQDTGLETVSEGRPLQERISLPRDRNDHYQGSVEVAGNNLMDDVARFEHPYEDDYPPEPSEATRDTRRDNARSSSSGKEDNISGTKESSLPNKDPEELRQKVLESLAEKKKKAAEFMNMEKEGASIHKDQLNDSKAPVNTIGHSDNGAVNPERDAAVDALLAKFNPSKDGGGPPANADLSRKNSETEFIPVEPNRVSPGRSDAQQLKHEQYNKYDDRERPASRGERNWGPKRFSDQGIRQDDHARYKDGHGNSRNPSLSSGRHDQRGDFRKSTDYDERDRRQGGTRPDLRYRHNETNYSKDYKTRNEPASTSGRKVAGDGRYAPPADDRRDPRFGEFQRAPEVARVDHPKDVYMKPSRYPAEPPLPDVEYNATVSRDYPPYPPPPGRYATPREDHRYPQPVPRPPETDYAALYYRDLNEWLDITGYHDYSYRQMQIQRHREARVLEESNRYALEHEPAYAPRATREDTNLRRPHYSMPPPPPLTSTAWDDREAAKRSITGAAPVRPGYVHPEERGRDNYRGDDLSAKSGPLKRRPRDDDFGEPPHSAKSARHNYDSHRKITPYGGDSGPVPRSVLDDAPADEADAVRQALSQRIASTSGRGREASPGANVVERSRRRSLSPQRPPFDSHKRDFSKGRKSPGPSPRFEGRGRATTKFLPRDDFRKPFRPRRNSLGEPASPHDRKPFGRGRGRGYSKDYPVYDRHDQHDRRSNFGDLSDIDRTPGFQGESMRNSDTRYFMIKSFNQDNVKMALKDNIWATQQKNSEILEQAFKEARHVMLFFSINKSGKFQGYARMEGAPGSAPVPTWAKNLLWESSGPFRIHWVTVTDISFHRVAHLRNRLNENQPVLIGRDGQEIDPDCGAALCRTIDETAAFRKLHGPSED